MTRFLFPNRPLIFYSIYLKIYLVLIFEIDGKKFLASYFYYFSTLTNYYHFVVPKNCSSISRVRVTIRRLECQSYITVGIFKVILWKGTFRWNLNGEVGHVQMIALPSRQYGTSQYSQLLV